MPHQSVRRAFTLIELLTAIAIVGILAGILFPVFAKAREQGRKTSCTSNLRQIGLALRMYAEDWNGRLPVAATQPSANPAKLRLDQALDAYVKAPNLFRCPSDSAWWQTEGLSYGWVELFDHQRLARPRFMGLDLTELPCVADAKSWHLGGKNALWLDGHVKYVLK